MKPINKLSHRFTKNAKYGCSIQLEIDGELLIDLLENAIPSSSEWPVWAEKKDALLIVEDLVACKYIEGKIDLLTCAGCGRPDDLMLNGCEVAHDGNYILWSILPPGAGVFFEDAEPVKYKFHRPQFEKEAERIRGIKQ